MRDSQPVFLLVYKGVHTTSTVSLADNAPQLFEACLPTVPPLSADALQEYWLCNSLVRVETELPDSIQERDK